jgi:hypothetical protein
VTNNVENCENCAFWVGVQCRRRAPGGPFPYRGEGGAVFVDTWPHSEPTDFCGDFELKDAQ